MSDRSDGSRSEENYEVEGIVGHKDSTRSGRKYKIKWKGYKETTFEPRENLVPSSEKFVLEYDKKHPLVKTKNLRKEKPKPKQETKSRRTKRNKIIDSESDDEATDSNIENEKPNGKVNKKRALSKRVKSKMEISNSTSKSRLNSSKKRAKVTRKVKSGGKRSSAMKSSSEGEYEVDILLDHRDEAARRMYLVKWEGYPTSEATWEPSSNLSCNNLVRQYEHLKGKWKRPRKRSRGSGEKHPIKRVRTSPQSNESDHEEKEKILKKRPEGGVKKVGTLSKVSEGDKADDEDVTEETSAPENDEKREDQPETNKQKEDTPKTDSNQGSNLDKSPGGDKIKEKVEADDGAETKEAPDDKKVEEDLKPEDQSSQKKKSGNEGKNLDIVG